MSYMKSSRSYVLVLAQKSDDLLGLEILLEHLSCSVAIAHSEEQALIRVNQGPPYLVILAGSQQDWSQAFVHELRRLTNTEMTIVSLTDSQTPSWLHQEDNPGVDGFLVEPISGEILKSLVQSAWARQGCWSAV